MRRLEALLLYFTSIVFRHVTPWRELLHNLPPRFNEIAGISRVSSGAGKVRPSVKMNAGQTNINYDSVLTSV